MQAKISTPPLRTMVTVGLTFIASSIFGLVDAVTERGSFGAFLASAVLFLIASIVLAWGMPGEPSIVGLSTIGRVVLVILGLRSLAFLLVSPLSFDLHAAAAVFIHVGLTILFSIAAVMSGIFVVRGRQLAGLARWILLVAGAIYAALAGLSLFSVIEVAEFLAAVRADVIVPVLFLVVGVVYLVQSTMFPRRR